MRESNRSTASASRVSHQDFVLAVTAFLGWSAILLMHQSGDAETAMASNVGGVGLVLMTLGERGAALAPVAPARWAFLMVHRAGLLIASAWGFVWHGDYPAPARAFIVAASAWWLFSVVKGMRGPTHEAFNEASREPR